MNIKEVEQRTGVSAQNIRFYEKAELFSTKRNPDNGYREYSENDVRILKVIKMLRMLDMPLEQIKLVLREKENLSNSLDKQQHILEKRISDDKNAIEFCKALKKKQITIDELNVEEYLQSMEKEHFFTSWIKDYMEVVDYEHERVITFTPDDAIINSYDFENVLYKYAMERDMEIEITKKGMYPEFTLDGIEYIAERNYARGGGLPVAIVRCTRKDLAETKEEYKHGRKKWLRILHIYLPGILVALFIIVTSGINNLRQFFSSMEGLILLGVIIIVCLADAFRNYYFYWNRDNKYEDKEK
ncbi:MerR family transcriptional regulator [Lacrimispora xylanisolvens]|uniref:MerR family transcriptional regulator n=1 Tax=Lacrimispora xylanisolvens TaxID=384636 RepID=UPI0024029550